MDDQVISKITTTESTVQRRARFGNRLLEETSDVFAHNAWDNVQWDEEQRQTAIDKVSLNSADRVEKQRVIELDERASHYWDTFYQTHQDKFFKDRQWLFIEFPEFLINCPDVRRRIALEASKDPHRHTHRPDADPLSCKCTGPQNPNYVDPNVQSDSTLPDMANASLRIWENGCGVGNTIISILETNSCPNTVAFCSDFSNVAIDVLKNRCADDPRCQPFVYDATADPDSVVMPFDANSLDIIVMIFALSAISPDKMQTAVRNAVRYLRPGGVFLFRDYGRYDLAQLRFKTGRCLGDNFYVRGDGTRAYFFTEHEVHQLLTGSDLQKRSLYVDQRLIVNRSRQIKMYRVWLQAKYAKPLLLTSS